MTLHQLQYFAEIVRQRSFTRAARQLHISQPALSKSVRLPESRRSSVHASPCTRRRRARRLPPGGRGAFPPTAANAPLLGCPAPE